MKGGFYGLRGKQISLILIALVCTTIFIWGWGQTPFLTSLLPTHGRLLQFSPEIMMGAPTVNTIPSKPHISAVTEKEVVHEVEGHHSDAGNQSDSVKISPGTGKTETNVTTPPVKKGDMLGKEMEKKQEGKHSDAAARIDLEKSSPAEERVTEEKIKDNLALEGENQTKGSANRTAQVASASTSSLVWGKANKSSTALSKNQACNYAKGKWILDESRPLYSGFGCKQWLSGMWACRVTQRTDFAYEKLRWKPNNCAMEDFTGSKFLQRMQNKTIAFVGDSLGRQQFQSLMCMATGGEEMPDVLDVGKEYGLVKARGAIRPDGWAYHFPSTNTTILYYWSASLSDLEPLNISNPKTDYAMHLDRPPAFLQRFLHKFDVLVLNTGHHWNRGKFNANRWVMHVGGIPNTNADIGGAKNFTIYSIVNWVNSQIPKYPSLKAFFRTISPRHFFNGDWNTGGTCDNTNPGILEVLQDDSSDPPAAGAVKGTKVKLLDITALSQLRDEGHISRYSLKATPGMQDCLHWCLPGVPDTWNELLFAQL